MADYFEKAVKRGSLNAYPVYCLSAEKTSSKTKYDEAIRVCSRSGLVNFEAIANENASLYFFLNKGTKNVMGHILHVKDHWP
jgi:hypothetical protein